ncbi:hypothetical protein EIN_222780 [Entamoeba invadens IP1]|uniref:Uncharacterized protein n=1 Tax=Entamoeba invadens IP1 TaxID=370355 RepID=A0A0A1U5J3_ENTIV|nr:hypothetical protein EIN_222780 [Entamoeba invadens IP1]ELP88115.1 hypothetical protein EIN_222780 [Entamoeba invadens IP1]|eukprot:XP_004254886.1 hypothetical protein EIN_222780 [Entamoeba invadens IP1]
MGCKCRLNGDGLQANEFFESKMKTCLYDVVDYISYAFGLVNILFWLVAQAPQIIKTFMIKKADSLSVTFLIMWIAGDITNLLGCIFTDQTQIQLYTSIFFVIVDSVMLSQYFYYKYIRQRIVDKCKKKKGEDLAKNSDVEMEGDEEKQGEAQSPKRNSDVSDVEISKADIKKLQHDDSSKEEEETSDLEEDKKEDKEKFASSDSSEKAVSEEDKKSDKSSSSKEEPNQEPFKAENATKYLLPLVLLLIFAIAEDVSSSTPPEEVLQYCGESNYGLFGRIFGDICAWISGLLYFVGRFPQAWHLYKTKNAEGMSILLFFSATMANVFYSVSVFMSGIDFTDPTFYESTLAYIVGSFFVIPCSLLIIFQYFYYTRIYKPKK